MFDEELHWIEYVKAFGPAIIASAVAFIAFQQWKLSQANLRDKLFERRIQVYEKVLSVLSSTSRNGRIEQSHINELAFAWRTSRFLFGVDVSDFISSLRDKYIDANYHLSSRYIGMPEEERQRHIVGEAENMKWIYKQFDPLFEVFLPYLGFQKHK